MRYELRPNLSPKRREWLEHLRDHGPAHRYRGRVGYDCMHLGWTEWNYVDKATRRVLSREEIDNRKGDDWWQRTDIDGERLTEAGREMLK